MAADIIVDEADVILINNEPLRSVINSGWTRGCRVPRCIGDDKTPHAFPTFCPKVIGMKGRKLPDTTLSRSIIIEMKRKKAGENVTHFRPSTMPASPNCGGGRCAGRSTTARSSRAPNRHAARLRQPARRQLAPAARHRRLRWRRVADKARKAAVKLSRSRMLPRSARSCSPPSRPSLTATTAKPLDRISSAELAAPRRRRLQPFSEWKSGKPITQAQLARVLKPSALRRQVIRLPGGGTPRGYKRAQFEDAWDRYL